MWGEAWGQGAKTVKFGSSSVIDTPTHLAYAESVIMSTTVSPQVYCRR